MSKEDKAEFNEAIKTAGRDYTQNQKNSQLEYVTAVQNAQQKFQEKCERFMETREVFLRGKHCELILLWDVVGA